MLYSFSIPGYPHPISLEAGETVIFVGANGSGKTRLGAYIDRESTSQSHRIAAHRALVLNPSVQKIPEETALLSLRLGGPTEQYSKVDHRWNGKEAVFLLNDFDYLVQALFANQTNIALDTHNRAREGASTNAEPTNFELLKDIWQRLLPHRELEITGYNIMVKTPGTEGAYSASEMSDGERSIFYLTGQVLTAERNSLLIFDEPELHIHRGIASRLWDELLAARPDCGFVIITHDLEFASSRAAQKFVIRDYHPEPEWQIQSVPMNSGFDEETITRILGSRHPILFVEGTNSSIDLPIYRAIYPDWTVIPRGGTESVIHAVNTLRQNSNLTRIICRGIIDADNRSDEDIQALNKMGVEVLPVAEIENILALPLVSREIARHLSFNDSEIQEKQEELSDKIFALLGNQSTETHAITLYCQRRLTSALKYMDLGKPKTIQQLEKAFRSSVEKIDIQADAREYSEGLSSAIREKDLEGLLAVYSNKGILSITATIMRDNKKDAFVAWFTRTIETENATGIRDALVKVLPKLPQS